jgi:carboxyl-terminal processing protease
MINKSIKFLIAEFQRDKINKFCLSFLLPLSLHVGSNKAFAEDSLLVPTEFMVHETKWLLQALEQAHFERVNINDLNATVFIEEFLNNLDKRKLFFTKQDLDNHLTRYKQTLPTYLKQGNLFPGFEIYREYQEKSLKRIAWSIDLLQELIDIESNQTVSILDPEKISWANSTKELNQRWTKLITHEYLNEIISQIDENASIHEVLKSLPEKKKESKKRLIKKYERWSKNILEFEATDLQEIYLTTITQQFDPHTSFLNIKEKERFDQTMQNEFVGIGAVLTDEDGFCTIKELLPGGPAEASRELEPEDVILKVAQGEEEFVDVVDMKLSKIVELIKGPKDTIVRLKIRPIKDTGSSKTIKIIRDRIKLTANLASSTIHNITNEKTGSNSLIGVIELPSFYGSNEKGNKATDDVEELINELKEEGAEGLILDLRRNGGGYLSEAVNLAGLFISRGPVVQVKSTDGKIRKKFDFNPKLTWDGPLIILVSRYSASASEIVAGALKNHRRAIIVGDKSTHGKGTVQSLLPMGGAFYPSSDGPKKSAAKITIQKYYLPSGESTQLSGVKSDIVMNSANEFLPIGEADLKNALPWDKIGAVNFRRPTSEFKYNDEVLDLLQIKSMNRQAKNPEFSYLKTNIEIFKEKKNREFSSLNLEKRISEKLEDEKRTKELKLEYDSFSKMTFPKKDIKLNIVKDQERRSLVARGETADQKNDSNSFVKPENMDIRLHETIRIMKDWIVLLQEEGLSKNTTVETKRI